MTELELYDATDLPWITLVVDHVMSCIGQPWRVLREHLEHAPISAARVSAILAAMRRVMEGRGQRSKIAREIRAAVLGHPALDEAARTARLAHAGEELGIDPAEIESLLWIDLAEERPVVLPDGRPDAPRLAAFANVDRVQRALRRARHVRIRAWGNPLPLVRMAARCGLLVHVSSDEAGAAIGSTLGRTGACTVVDIVGPLALFHQTNVYGRAIGAIVPHLAGLERFLVEIDADLGYGLSTLRVSSPALLPPPAQDTGTSIAARIARALERAGVPVERDPAPIAHGPERLLPDLVFEPVARAATWFVEVVGFATTEYLRAKLARYAAAGIERVVLVVDDTSDGELQAMQHVVTYAPKTTVTDLLAVVAARSAA